MDDHLAFTDYLIDWIIWFVYFCFSSIMFIQNGCRKCINLYCTIRNLNWKYKFSLIIKQLWFFWSINIFFIIKWQLTTPNFSKMHATEDFEFRSYKLLWFKNRLTSASDGFSISMQSSIIIRNMTKLSWNDWKISFFYRVFILNIFTGKVLKIQATIINDDSKCILQLLKFQSNFPNKVERIQKVHLD